MCIPAIMATELGPRIRVDDLLPVKPTQTSFEKKIHSLIHCQAHVRLLGFASGASWGRFEVLFPGGAACIDLLGDQSEIRLFNQKATEMGLISKMYVVLLGFPRFSLVFACLCELEEPRDQPKSRLILSTGLVSPFVISRGQRVVI